MGTFYTNITLRGPSQSHVAQALRGWASRAYVSPTMDEYTIVYDQACDTQDTELIHTLTSRLSAEFDCPALAVLNHDDDIFCYWLYEHGELTDEFDSSPGYFEGRLSRPKGGHAGRLCALTGCADVEGVEAILKTRHGSLGYEFESERHEELAEALGLPAEVLHHHRPHDTVGVARIVLDV